MTGTTLGRAVACLRATAATAVMAAAVALVIALAATLLTPLPAGAGGPSWDVGDCLASGDVEAKSVDLTSDVSCDEEHVAQIVGGASLPAALESLSRSELFAASGSTRKQLDAFVDKTCAPTPILRNLYPKKTAKALASVIEDQRADQWIVPAAGRFDIALPDQDSYDAGTHAVLCVFLPDDSLSGSTAGDVRDVATGDPLDALRRCFVRRSSATGTDPAPCAEDHDFEGLLWMRLRVDDLPQSVVDWPESAWVDFDDACDEVGAIVVGADRDDLTYRARTNVDLPIVDHRRWIYCEAAPAAPDVRLPGGVSVAGLDRRTIDFVAE